MHVTHPSQIKLRDKRLLIKPISRDTTAGGIVIPEELQDKGQDIVWEVIGKSDDAETPIGTHVFVAYEATIRPANLRVTMLRVDGVPHAALPEEFVIATVEGVA